MFDIDNKPCIMLGPLFRACTHKHVMLIDYKLELLIHEIYPVFGAFPVNSCFKNLIHELHAH